MTAKLILANSTSLGADTFRQRVEVAAAAGFRSIGLSLAEFRRISSTESSPAEMRSVLDDHGVALQETEALFGFSADASLQGVEIGEGFSYATDRDVDEFFRFGEYFGATHLQVVPTFGTDELEPDAVERFAALCDRASTLGMSIALEFVPGSNVPEAGAATRLVVAAGRSNGGICVDSWHYTRGANDPALLRAIPRDKIGVIQFNDGTAEQRYDYFTETMHYRKVPCEGEFDLPGFFAALSGATHPKFSVEIMSDELGRMNPADAARHVFEASTAALEKYYRAPGSPDGQVQTSPAETAR
jgi:sugar phosphate isomerase/epimerase